MSAGRVVLALLLIILGVLILAANLGWLGLGFIVALLQLWPLLLVIAGIYVLLGRSRGALASVLAAVVVIAGLAIAFVAWQMDWISDGEAVTGRIVGPGVSQVEDAELSLNVGALDLDLRGGDGRRVVEGTYELRGDPSIVEDLDGSTYALTLNQNGSGITSFLSFVESQSVDLTLGSGVVWDIEVDMGASGANLDLEEVTLGGLRLDAGASSLDLVVGEVTDGAEIVIEGGAGSYDLSLPDDLDITLTTDTGLSSTDVDNEFIRDGDQWRYDGGGERLEVRIDVGVSSIDVTLY